jgi:hypothetical protein
VPSHKTAAEAEQAGIPSLGSSMDEIAKQLGGQLVRKHRNAVMVTEFGSKHMKAHQKLGRVFLH